MPNTNLEGAAADTQTLSNDDTAFEQAIEALEGADGGDAFTDGDFDGDDDTTDATLGDDDTSFGD